MNSPTSVRSYVIAATPRSGSELLCEALHLTGFAGKPWEQFQNWTGTEADSSRTFRQVYQDGSTDNGVFGVKIMWEQLPIVARALEASVGMTDAPPLAILARAWPNLQVVHLSRKDVLRQAVSWSKAIGTGRWSTDEPATATAVYDAGQIEWCRKVIPDHERSWSSAFRVAGLTPLHIMYEDLVNSYEDTMSLVLRFLSLPMPDPRVFVGRQLQAQSDDTNEEWIRRFLEERALRIVEEDSGDHRCD